MLKIYPLYSGSTGNCIFIAYKNTKILVDCGVSGKRIVASLQSIDINPYDIDAILITHEHRDHIHSAGSMSRKYHIPVYANIGTWDGMRDIIGSIKEANTKILNTSQEFYIKDIKINSFNIPHDANEPIGYNFFADSVKTSIATDIGHITEEIVLALENSDTILIEANHDIEMLKVGNRPYSVKRRVLSEKGHLCNEACGQLVAYLAKKGTKEIILGHLSKENNFPELAYQTVYNELVKNGIRYEYDINLSVATDKGIIYRNNKKELIVV